MIPRLRMARIHSKYLELFTVAKMTYGRADMAHIKHYLKTEWLYYNGKLSKEEI